jgi:hypothetical protein
LSDPHTTLLRDRYELTWTVTTDNKKEAKEFNSFQEFLFITAQSSILNFHIVTSDIFRY